MPIRVALLGNQPIILFAINSIIESHEDITIVVEDNLENDDFFSNLTHIDVLLLEFKRDELLQKRFQFMRTNYPDLKIVMLVDSDNDCYDQKLLDINANACIAKDEINESLIHILRAVNTGKKMLSWSVAEKIVNEQNCTLFDYSALGLTDGEWNVLQLMIKGSTNSQIADALCLSPQTIRNKATQIYGKLGVDSRLNLLKWAHEHRIAA